MKSKHILILAFLVCATGIYAQFGIKAGVNLANEIKSFSQSDISAGFSSKNLTGYQIGFIYQAMPKKSGLGFEIGALLSQKGSSFSDSTNVVDFIKQGYKELNYIEVPLNLRYRISMGFIGLYGMAGVYGGYILNGKTVNETTNNVQTQTFQTFVDHVDYGYNLGLGLELFKKIQFGLNWSQGIRNTTNSIAGLPTPTNTTNRVYTVNLVYLF
jgi:hypothetical protein